MSRRKKTSGGQAIVMVTMALFAMVGLMGLAVDLGWSFFVQKQAQSAVDGAAMAAVQEAYHRMSGQFFNVTCGIGANQVYCDTGAGLNCNGVAKTSTDNVANGCLYAASDGWCSVGASTVSCPTGWTLVGTSNVGGATGTAPPSSFCPPGVNCGTLDKRNVPYWVRMTATETVPQLFSAILKNPTATVAASAVAGINGTQVPGSLVLLDRPGDGYADPSGNQFYGNDIYVGGFLFNSINASGPIYMASTCAGSYVASSCAVRGTNAGYAGDIAGFASSVTGSAIEMPTGAKTNGNTWTCSGGGSPCPTNIATSSVFLDPTSGEAQPSINVTAAVPTCGIYDQPGIGAVIQGTTTGAPLQLGPFNYYSYTTTNGKVNGTPSADGAPIIIKNNVQFIESGSCTAGIIGAVTDTLSRAANSGSYAGGSGSTNIYHIYDITGATLQSSGFDAYLFYGGLWLEGATFNNANATLGPGQYVMVGTATSTTTFGDSCASSKGTILCSDNAFSFASAIQGDTSSGTMFILTSPVKYIGSALYPGLAIATGSTPKPEITAAMAAAKYEGGVNIENVLGATSLTGVVPGGSKVPTSLNQYNGVLFWQDRANSTVMYSTTGQITSQTQSPSTQNPPSGANGMDIFGIIGGVNVNGVIYQPEGAYLTDGGAIQNMSVSTQIITGAININGVFGISVTLGTPTHELTKYSPGLLE